MSDPNAVITPKKLALQRAKLLAAVKRCDVYLVHGLNHPTCGEDVYFLVCAGAQNIDDMKHGELIRWEDCYDAA